MLFAINTSSSFFFCTAEPIIVEVVYRNPLKVPLALSALSLLWKFTVKDFSGPQDSTSGETISNVKEAVALKEVRPLIVSRFTVPEASGFEFLITLIKFLHLNLFQTTALNDIIDTQVIPEFTISPEETKVVRAPSSLDFTLLCTN